MIKLYSGTPDSLNDVQDFLGLNLESSLKYKQAMLVDHEFIHGEIDQMYTIYIELLWCKDHEGVADQSEKVGYNSDEYELFFLVITFFPIYMLVLERSKHPKRLLLSFSIIHLMSNLLALH